MFGQLLLSSYAQVCFGELVNLLGGLISLKLVQKESGYAANLQFCYPVYE